MGMNLGAVTTPSRVWPRRGRTERRVAKLTSMRFRRGLATGLRRVLKQAEQPPAVFSSKVPLRRREIFATRALIEDLAVHLDDESAVAPRGVALVERLLTFGGSPLYAPHPDGALEADLRHARAALLLEV